MYNEVSPRISNPIKVRYFDVSGGIQIPIVHNTLQYRNFSLVSHHDLNYEIFWYQTGDHDLNTGLVRQGIGVSFNVQLQQGLPT